MTQPPLRACLHHAVALSFLALFSVSQVSLAGEGIERDPHEYFFTQSFGDLPEEMEEAKKSGKQGMLLFFQAEACPYCEYMLNHIFNQKDVQDWFGERFVSLSVDIHGDVELKDFDGITLPSKVFANQRRVHITPLISFIDHDAVEVYRHYGMIKTVDEFLLIGEYIDGKHYYDTEYRVFSESRGLAQPGGALVSSAAATDHPDANQKPPERREEEPD